MNAYLHNKTINPIYRILSALIAVTFAFSCVVPTGYAQTASQTMLNLPVPVPGTVLPVSSGFTPPLIRGLTIYPEDALHFGFIVNPGDTQMKGNVLKDESTKLIKYFLASLTVPEEQLWVNLSPYEKGRIISKGLGQTEMGRDMLAQDYLLKQLTASLMYPEQELGKEFWDRVYKKAHEKYGTTDIPMNTFNKIWIIPESATVLVSRDGLTAYVAQSRLKVMLEEDYVALAQNAGNAKFGMNTVMEEDAKIISGVSSKVIKEVLIPEIEKEVNEGKTFANLRQIYHSLILAVWYKQNLKESLLGQVYVDQNKTKGIDLEDTTANEKIYARYAEVFKSGVYDYIREEYDPTTDSLIPRKYFSGGVLLNEMANFAFDPENFDIVTVRSGASLSDYGVAADQSSSSVLVDAKLIEVGRRERAPEEIKEIMVRVGLADAASPAAVFGGEITRDVVPAAVDEEAVEAVAPEAQAVQTAVPSAAGETTAAPAAQEAQAASPLGAIDFRYSNYLDMQILRDERGIPLPMAQQPIATIHIEGIIPVIIDIIPVNVPMLLGMINSDRHE